MKILNTFLLTSLVLFAFIPAAIAQENEDPESSSLTEDSRAFQFRVTNNFNLSSFHGSAFSYKWHKSESNARRLGIGFNNWYQHEDDSIIHENDESAENESGNKRMDFNISVNYDWIHYPNSDSEFQFFYGYGPEVRTGFRRNKDENDDRTSTENSIEGAIGLAGFSGIEWFFHRSMSLHAEYRASAIFTYVQVDLEIEASEDSSFNDSEQTIKRSIIELKSRGVRFGLSVYF